MITAALLLTVFFIAIFMIARSVYSFFKFSRHTVEKPRGATLLEDEQFDGSTDLGNGSSVSYFCLPPLQTEEEWEILRSTPACVRSTWKEPTVPPTRKRKDRSKESRENLVEGFKQAGIPVPGNLKPFKQS